MNPALFALVMGALALIALMLVAVRHPELIDRPLIASILLLGMLGADLTVVGAGAVVAWQALNLPV